MCSSSPLLWQQRPIVAAAQLASGVVALEQQLVEPALVPEAWAQSVEFWIDHLQVVLQTETVTANPLCQVGLVQPEQDVFLLEHAQF